MTKTERTAYAVNGRQLCFFAAFLAPASKLLAAPALLSYFAKGDLLLPALAHYLLQGCVLAAILFLASRSEKGFFGLVEERLGKPAAKIAYGAYALYFAFSALSPLLDFERFVYTAFFDTAPSMCIFCTFFLFSGFVCVKGARSFGRSADLAMPLFLVSFAGLFILSAGTADFSNLLPLFGTPISSSAAGFKETLGHFSDTALFLPLLDAYRYKKGDGKKIALSFAGGGAFVLVFLALFYGVFGPLAPRQEFAFAKTAQYFPGLAVVGRFDLLLLYMMTVVLLFYYAFILQSCVYCFTRAVGTQKRVLPSVVLNAALFLYVLLCTGFYNVLYYAIARRLFWVFLLFADVVPLLALLLLAGRKDGAPRETSVSGTQKAQADSEPKAKPGRQAENGRESGSEEPPERHPERRPKEAPAPSSDPSIKDGKKAKEAENV